MSGHLLLILRWGSRYCCFPAATAQKDSRTHTLECIQCVSSLPPPPLLQVQVQQQKAGVQRRARVEGRLQQHELAIALHQEAPHLRVRAAGGHLLADDPAQVRGQLRLAVVDALVLADQAPHLPEQVPGAGLLHRIGQPVRRVPRRPGGEPQGAPDHGQGRGDAPHALAPAAAAARALAPAAMRSRRSERETSPPSAISSGPPKIIRAQGFQ